MKKVIGAVIAAMVLAMMLGGMCAAAAESPEASDALEPAYADVPRVDIEGDMTGISKKTKKDVTITYTSATLSFTSYATIKWQGTSSVSQGYPKQNYAIELFADEEHDTKDKRAFRDWLSANEYCLKANWIDSTHARNIVGARLAASIQKTPLPSGVSGLIDGFPIHVYLNGEDQGIYTWNIPKKAWLFNMSKKNPDCILYCADSKLGSCVFETEAVDDGSWDLVYSGGAGDELEKLNRVIRFVKDSPVEEFREHFHEYFDFDSVVDYYVYSQIMANIDGVSKNMLLATFDGKVWYVGLYDLDTLCGTSWTGKLVVSEKVLYGSSSFKPFSKESVLWSKFEQAFGNEIYDRYIELSTGVLSYDNIIAEFVYFMDGIGPELYELDDQLWTDKSEKHPFIPSREYGLQQIETYMKKREPYTQEWMESLRTE